MKAIKTVVWALAWFCVAQWAGAQGNGTDSRQTSSTLPAPNFAEVAVHDPSILKDGDTYWVFGTHLAAARSEDLIQWTRVANGVRDDNPLIPNVSQELAETLAWATSPDLWAPCVTKLPDGKYYQYYCSCQGRSPLSALGVAVSDKIEGPYKNLKILLKSGRGTSEDGTPYNARIHPNAIDPHTFFDADSNYWMVYGSFSGGIFILKMDPKTGCQFPGQGYGKKLMGGNHSKIEGAYMQYSPQTGYYYLFASFGELGARGGYNIRVARSKKPDGPFLDPQGNDMTKCMGSGSDDVAALESYGAKLIGNYRFLKENGEPTGIAYASPGHNSTYYDTEKGKYFIFFHTRFPQWGQGFQMRVHQMFLNEDGWFVIAPHRYAGETLGAYTAEALEGTYAFVNHGRDISATVKDSVPIAFHRDGTITGALAGRWKKQGEHGIRVTLDGTTWDGVALRQWDDGLKKPVMAITALSSQGSAIWATQISSSASPNQE